MDDRKESESQCAIEENVSSDTNIQENSTVANINTSDPIPLSSKKQEAGALKKLFSLLAIFTLIAAIIFSSTKAIGTYEEDYGFGRFVLRRIFGQDAYGDSMNLYELMIGNSFPATIHKDDKPSTDPPIQESQPVETVPPETFENDFSTQEPEESSPSETPPSGDNVFPIVKLDMSLLSYGENYIYNDTDLTPDLSRLASAELRDYYTANAPLVLVVHTHGTESYMPEGATYYVDEGELARSNNTEENMIAVGKEFVRVLEENGIKTLHCTVMHDKESYRESYSRAAESIAKYLAEYPSIKYVFDIHRDSIMRADGELISAVATVNGESHAQIMPVIGSGASNWNENMTFALKLRASLNGEYTNLCRPICLRESSYNQGMSAISVLLEIGASGNSLPEAKRAAALTAKAIASLIKN